MTAGETLLRAGSLVKHYHPPRSWLAPRQPPVVAVDNVSLDVIAGETLGLVGESGCGKSTLGRCFVRLTTISGGSLEFEGKDITDASVRELRPVRRRMQMVFQDPYASLNPRRRVGDLIAEPLIVHKMGTPTEIKERVIALLRAVELSPEHAQRYPHEFSGGQRQRVGIARALALEPRLIVADEPVSALDVSVQAQVINLMIDLRERLGLTYVFIAHDLSVVRQISTRVAVMYLGAIVELGPADAVFGAPRHPYTRALLSAAPVTDLDRPRRGARIVLEGDIPSPSAVPTGCRFHTRCPYADRRCRAESPALLVAGPDRFVACHKPM
jgi:peptide/nickel transport system ATP-binding protein